MSNTWDILICAIPHRLKLLNRLLHELQQQIEPGVGVIVCYDNLENEYGAKVHTMIQASDAEYISMIDDDDMIAPDYVHRILTALQEKPDYVGFAVEYTIDGQLQVPVYHSLKYPNWQNTAEALYRDLVHFNPIKRELALLGEWSGGMGADFRWASQVRETKQVKTEVYIDEPMYHYMHSEFDSFLLPRQPFEELPDPPDYPFVRYVYA